MTIARMLRTAIGLFLMLTLITGVVYPVAMTLLAQAIFPFQANGSVLMREDQPQGSLLLGQAFTGERYFRGRPSMAAPEPYDAMGGVGSNLAATNPALLARIEERVKALRSDASAGASAVPVDLVTCSASGLDPHISPAAALYQVPRVARLRGLPVEKLRGIVMEHVEPPVFGVLGQARVNVMRLNLDLDAAKR